MSRDHEQDVDEFDLELQLAGAELDPARRAALDRAEHLEPVRDEMVRLAAWWAEERRPLPGVSSARPRTGRWRWMAAIAAAAVVLAVAVATPQAPTYRARGVVAVDVVHVRGGAPVDPREPVLAGDQLGLALVPDAPGYVHVATLQRDGGVSLLVTGQQVAAGARFALPGRLELDDHEGREWLVVLATPDRPPRGEIEERLRAMLPDPGAHAGDDRWVFEVTRGGTLR